MIPLFISVRFPVLFVHLGTSPFDALVHLAHLNHFVRSRQHIRRDRQADLLRGLKIDHELELRRLLHRQIGRLGPLRILST